MSLDQLLFPDTWKVTPISSVVFFQEGPGVRKFQYTDSGVKLLNGGNINNGVLNLKTTERYISDEEAYGKYKHFLVEDGDLLIACSGVVVEKFDGKIAYANEEDLPLCMNTSTMRFQSLDSEILHLDYFRWFLQTSYFKRQLQQLITGSAQLNFGPSHIKQMTIPLPPLETQKQIAAVLEKADQLRKGCQQIEQELNSFAQSVFIEMFGDPSINSKGWEIGTIRDLLVSANYGTSEKSSSNILQYPVLRMNNITYQGGWDFSSLKYMDMAQKDEQKYLVNRGDLLFNRTNSKELVGKTAVYREKKPMAYAGYLVRARCNSSGNPEYISAFMNSKYGKQTLQSMCKSIVGMANINAQEFQSIKIPTPPIALQNEFENRTKKILSLVNESKIQQEKYNDLFNTLMQKAFKGKLKLDKSAT